MSTDLRDILSPACKVIVTGGLGFIGSAFTRRLVSEGVDVVVVDVGTYAADSRRLESLGNNAPRVLAMDVADAELPAVLKSERPGVIVHFAADSHVTRSERDPDRFFRTNVQGTERVLEAGQACDVDLVVHISTDEVYGPCLGDPFREEEKQPGEGLATSAYARSKALADDVARSWTDRLPVIIARPTNCVGPWQHPEKAVPRWIIRALKGERLPVWGSGDQMRDWMYVDDLCLALGMLIDRGVPGEVYNIGPEGAQLTNLEIAKVLAREAGCPKDSVYLTEYDRPQHDHRYAVDTSKVRALGWRPSTGFEEWVKGTIAWYRDNAAWWEPLVGSSESLYDDAKEGRLPTR